VKRIDVLGLLDSLHGIRVGQPNLAICSELADASAFRELGVLSIFRLAAHNLPMLLIHHHQRVGLAPVCLKVRDHLVIV